MKMCHNPNCCEISFQASCESGLGVGIHAIAVPTYIGEVSTPDVRGKLGAAFQLFVTVGITIAYLGKRDNARDSPINPSSRSLAHLARGSCF